MIRGTRKTLLTLGLGILTTAVLALGSVALIGSRVGSEIERYRGVLISRGANSLETAPWLLIIPAICLAITMFCFNFIGDGLRDALDPKDR